MEFNLACSWGLLIQRGGLAILFGILALLWPAMTLDALIVLFGGYALTDGVLALAVALPGGEGGRPRWSLILEGTTSIMAGLATVCWPWLTALALLCLIGSRAVATGLFELVAASPPSDGQARGARDWPSPESCRSSSDCSCLFSRGREPLRTSGSSGPTQWSLA